MQVLGIDLGEKRVGLAVAETGSGLALPLATLSRTTRDKLFAELGDVVAKRGIETIVLGLPLALTGDETESSRQARNFAASLTRRFALPVVLVNEALTSFAAEEDLRGARVSGKKRAKAIDQQAAVHILRAYLDGQGETP